MTQQIVDFSFLYDISDNDPQYINEVIKLFLNTMPDGLNKLEVLINDTEDWDAIYKQAHFLKSSASVVRIKNMFDDLAQIEVLAKKHAGKNSILPVFNNIAAAYKEAYPVLIAEQAKAN